MNTYIQYRYIGHHKLENNYGGIDSLFEPVSQTSNPKHVTIEPETVTIQPETVIIEP
jgi:hypothetical protein